MSSLSRSSILPQSELLGLDLPTSTLSDWTASAIDLLKPQWKAANRDTLGYELVSVDDTHLPVLDRDHPAGIKKKGHLRADAAAESSNWREPTLTMLPAR